MSTLFMSLVKPPALNQDATYRINPTEYTYGIYARWPYAKVIDAKFADYILSWELNKENELGMAGGLQSNRMVVSFSSNPRNDSIDFILWHRNFVPETQALFLFDESLEFVIELKSDMTAESLRDVIK